MIISNVDSALNKRHFARWGLGDRNRIRNPFYGEVRRDNTSEIFGLVVRVVKNVLAKEFCSPLCFHAKNKKAEVISFTNIDAATKLLCLTRRT